MATVEKKETAAKRILRLNKEFKAELTELRRRQTDLEALSKKVYTNGKKGTEVILTLGGFPMQISKADIRNMQTDLTAEFKRIYTLYKSHTKRVKVAHGHNVAMTFDQPAYYKQNVIDFFTAPSNVAYLGYTEPGVDSRAWTLDMGRLTFGTAGQPLNQVLAANQTFAGQRLATQSIIRSLFYIYAAVNNLQGMSAANQGQVYGNWADSYTVDTRMEQYLSNELAALTADREAKAKAKGTKAFNQYNFKPLTFVPSINVFLRDADQGIFTDMKNKDNGAVNMYKQLVGVYATNFYTARDAIKATAKAEIEGIRESLKNVKNADRTYLYSRIAAYELQAVRPELVNDAKVAADQTVDVTRNNIANDRAVANQTINAIASIPLAARTQENKDVLAQAEAALAQVNATEAALNTAVNMFNIFFELQKLNAYVGAIAKNYSLTVARLADARTKLRTKVKAAEKKAKKAAGLA